MVVQPLSTSFGNYSFSSTYLGAVVGVFVWWLILQLPMHSMSITTYVVSSSPDHDKVYSIQHYVIKVISDLRQVGGFLRVLRFLYQQTNCYYITDILLKVVLNSITITLAFCYYSSSNHKLFNSIYYSWIKRLASISWGFINMQKFYHP
jgi:hypothetical protein